MGFALTIIEILVAFIIIIGFACEEKLAAFEQKAIRFIKRKLRKMMRGGRRNVRVVSARINTANEYCA